jgi:hypothetical protein
MRCPTCSTTVPKNAKFCPKCGKAAADSSTALPRAAGAHPSSAPIPRIGKVFIGLLFLGLALMGAGAVERQPLLLITGAIVVGVVALVAVIGHHVS